MIKYFLLSLFLLLSVEATQVNLTPTVASINVKINGEKIHISRMQDTQHKLRNEFSLTSRLSPPFEIQSYTVVEGVETISELEVFDFIQHKIKKGGILIDARLSTWFYQSTIPAAINIPFPTLAIPSKTLLKQFGITGTKGHFNFAKAKKVLIFDNGPWCPQATQAIHSLVKLGYPKEKILYYRGGMQYWSILGLIYAYPEENKKKETKGATHAQ